MKIREFLTYSIIASGLLFVSLNSCRSGQEKKDESSVQNALTGKQLAQQYCTGCHMSVSPTMADKESWDMHILPAMAPKLGIPVLKGNQYYQVASDKDTTGISYMDWMKLVAYFNDMAPEKLDSKQVAEPLQTTWSIFTLQKPDTLSEPATTTYVGIEPNIHHIYSANAITNKVYEWGTQLKPIGSFTTSSPVTKIVFSDKTTQTLTCIGSMRAEDILNGEVVEISLNNKRKKVSKTVFSGLLRPVQADSGDFNKDGHLDWVVCSFGHNTGSLDLFTYNADLTFTKTAIREIAGATQTVIKDFDQDGWLDIMALFASGDEGIWLFSNNHKGGFTSKNILRFPPIYGSTSFQLVDFNKDGKLDILYTCGDNSDYSRILKPYHGVYIYLNQGGFTYKQSYFYPVNGCTKALATDFDLDGDLDIASIAFFGDLVNKPEETFIYFEQTQSLQFRPCSVPIHQYGRWICMDVGDVDADGDIDIVLGNYSRGFINQKETKHYWSKNLPFVVLENTKRKRKD